MADDKKKPEAKKLGTMEEIVYLLAGLFLLAVILGQITLWLSSIGWGNLNTVWNYFLYSYLLPFWHNWKYIAAIISAGGIIWLIHGTRKLREIEREEEKIYGKVEHDSVMSELKPKAEKKNERWARVLEHAHSDNPADWRLAIIEADVMLEEVLRLSGFPGDTLGEMLKATNSSDMRTLDAAWEAHKVRNRIAHAGSDFELNERETRRVIALFEAVFKEFDAI